MSGELEGSLVGVDGEARWDGGMRLLYPRKVRAPCVLQLEDLWARKFVR